MPDVKRPFLIPVGNKLESATVEEYQQALMTVSGEDRKALKELNFGIMYGANPQKFMVAGSTIDWKSFMGPKGSPAEIRAEALRERQEMLEKNRRLGTLDELV